MRSREQVQAELMKKVEKAIEGVLDWQEEQDSFKFSELEEVVLEARQEVSEAMAEAVVERMESKHPVEVPHCGGCGARMAYKGQKTKTIVSRVGEVALERGAYHCPECGAGFSPSG
jgi:NADH pyrophosphatase NudC (nudix superfamily)